MKILQLAPIWERVPPPAYGGIEVVVSLLTEELVRQGHDVTLFASGDSITSATLRSTYPRSLRSVRDTIAEPEQVQWMHDAAALIEARNGYDVIHNHAGELPIMLSSLVSTPMLTTFHGPPSPHLDRFWPSYHGFYNSISNDHQRGYPADGYLGTIYHGMDVETFPFEANKEDHLLFLSRVSPEKGPVQAIDIARRLGKRLIIAGKVDWRDREFFANEVEPLIDGTQVCFVGEADSRQKRELYRKASALLLPLQWDEPFGLVITEAMACGTPVLALRRGAAPELVVHGKTGFITDTVDELAEAARHIGEIDPYDCRAHVEQHFSPKAMADHYVQAYAQVVRFQTREAMAGDGDESSANVVRFRTREALADYYGDPSAKVVPLRAGQTAGMPAEREMNPIV